MEKLGALIALNHVTLTFVKYALESFSNVSTRLCSDRYGLGALAKHVYAGKQVSHAVVERGQTRHVDQIDLVEVCDTFRIRLASRKTYSSGFVQGVGRSNPSGTFSSVAPNDRLTASTSERPKNYRVSEDQRRHCPNYLRDPY